MKSRGWLKKHQSRALFRKFAYCLALCFSWSPLDCIVGQFSYHLICVCLFLWPFCCSFSILLIVTHFSISRLPLVGCRMKYWRREFYQETRYSFITFIQCLFAKMHDKHMPEKISQALFFWSCSFTCPATEGCYLLSNQFFGSFIFTKPVLMELVKINNILMQLLVPLNLPIIILDYWSSIQYLCNC